MGPVVAGVIVAVNVTTPPNCGELGENVTAVLVDAWPTVTELAVEVLGAKSALPTYLAVTEFVPTGSDVVLRVADPAVRVAVPSEVAFSEKLDRAGGGPGVRRPAHVGCECDGLAVSRRGRCTQSRRGTDKPLAGRWSWR